MRPWELRLTFEPRTQPVFGPKFDCRVSHLQYNTKASVCRAWHRFFRGQKPRQRILILNSETLTGRSFFPSQTSCIHNDPNGTLFECRTRGITDGRDAGATQHNRHVSRICLTNRLRHEPLSSFHPPCRSEKASLFPQAQYPTEPANVGTIGSPGRRRERSIGETGGPDLGVCLF